MTCLFFLHTCLAQSLGWKSFSSLTAGDAHEKPKTGWFLTCAQDRFFLSRHLQNFPVSPVCWHFMAVLFGVGLFSPLSQMPSGPFETPNSSHSVFRDFLEIFCYDFPSFTLRFLARTPVIQIFRESPPLIFLWFLFCVLSFYVLVFLRKKHPHAMGWIMSPQKMWMS